MMGVMKYGLGCLMICMGVVCFAEDTEKVIARVGDQEITAEEFLVNLEYRLTATQEAQGRSITPDAQFRADTLNEVIDARILKILAKNEGVTADEETVKNEFVAGVKRLGGPEALPEYLKKMKLTEEDLNEEIRERLIMEKYIEQLTDKIEVGDDEVTARYETLKSAGRMDRKKTTVDFGYVMARTSGEGAGDFAEAKTRILKAHERLKAGEAVEKVAEELSDDDLFKVNKGVYKEMDPTISMIPKTAEQLSAMKPGDVTEPFMTGDGWHVIKLLQRNEPGIIELDRTKDFIAALIFEEKKAALLRDVVEKAKHVIRVEILEAKD